MNRSEINKAINDALAIFKEYKISLPEFACWTPEEWAKKGEETLEIKENMLGWDITDFGGGNFDEMGLLLITLRNGNNKKIEKYPKPYAEKLMVVKEKQITPMHFHWNKMEDIINKGGGNLMIKLYNSTESGELSESEVKVSIDGVKHVFPAGHVVRIKPGQSITLTQRLYHRFWGEEGYGTVIVSEVSMCNDDLTDNRFYDKVGRFPKIEEDQKPLRLLCNEYVF